ncbi:MAG TPA: hypothetical protein VIG32_12160 [Candidatus Baltobacteraceae bacterium]|jgi:hypothetical protein
MPETDARRALSGRALVFSVLAPVGSYAGVGTLRVLRVRVVPGAPLEPERIELACGYESYTPLNRPESGS